MRTLIRPLILAICTFLLNACSSLHKTAENHYLAEEYLAASLIYEKILASDKSDPIAQERLQRSRQKMIENRLIQVRQLRLSDNHVEALEQLTGVLESQAKWKVAPSGVAFSTQNEEVALLFRWVQTVAKSDIGKGNFLKAKLFIEKNKAVFGGGAVGKKFLKLSEDVFAAGYAHCQRLSASNQGPYSKEFINRYCIFWGAVEKKSNVREPSAVKSDSLISYSRMEIVGNIKGLPEEVLSSLAESLLTGLKQTPFYSSNGPALRVSLSGGFISRYVEARVIEVHSYQVEIPYQVAVTVPQFRNIPYTAYRSEYDYQTGQTYQVPYTKYRMETYYIQQMQTRYRSESRTMPYPATQFKQDFLLVAKAQFDIDRVKHMVPLDDQFHLTDSFHEAENDQIGLRSKSKRVPTAVEWLKVRFSESGDKFANSITDAWDSKYCRVPKSLLANTQIESVMKCIKGTKSEHDFVENWFQSNFGMSFSEVSGAIGFGA